MIKKINKTQEGDTLTVEVECAIREFAVHPIKILTTEQLTDILNKDYENLVLVKSPQKKIGNTNRKKITHRGTWIFRITEQENKKEKPAQNEQKKKPTRRTKPKATTEKKTQSQRSRKQTSSIRGRMSRLATKKD